MAAPHGVEASDLKCDFEENTSPEPRHEQQDVRGGEVDPSILSMFQEQRNTDRENEASLLSALTEMLDSVDVETLSPFDTLPDSEIFSTPTRTNHTLRDLLHAPSSSDRSPSVFRPRKEVILSDRQLRPRRCSEKQTKTNPTHSRSRTVRIFRMESDVMFPEYQLEILEDLVRHMHPYCLQVKAKPQSVWSEEDEEVDVEGLEEEEERPQLIPEVREEEEPLKTCEERRRKKTVSFAHNLTTVHLIPLGEEEPSENAPPPKKTISLQQYRLLRQEKCVPLEEKRMDYRTKWPTISSVPRGLPPILPEFKPDPGPELAISQPSLEKRRLFSRRRPADADPPNPTTVSLASASHDARTCFPQRDHTGGLLHQPADAREDPRLTDPDVRPAEDLRAEIGIEAADLTSLLEQFETQASAGASLPQDEHQHSGLTDLSSTAGLTPPATPPHHTWKPPSKTTKPSPSKTIQIIEPRPLPPSKSQARLPAASAGAFLDHDYCESSAWTESVLLSPDCSPCRTSCSPQRGRGRTRTFIRAHSSSRSCCSSCSSSSSDSRSRSRSPPRKTYRSRHSGSSSSSRSSSASPSPPRKHAGHSPRPALEESRSRRWSRRSAGQRRREEARRSRRSRRQKAIDERRVVYVGGIGGSMLPSDLKDRFSLFGRVEDCTVHLRSHGDNYGFVTYFSTDDAFSAIEKGSTLRRSDELPFDICFGGRRQFCKSNYADLDSNREVDAAPRTCCDSFDFDALLKQAQRGSKT